MSVIRTVAITNVDDSVVEERLRGFFSRCGPIRRMDFVATASPRKASIGEPPLTPVMWDMP